MPIQTQCPCGKQFTLKDDLAGREAKCPDCGATFRIPGPVSDRNTPHPIPARDHSPSRSVPPTRRRKSSFPTGLVGAAAAGVVVVGVLYSVMQSRPPAPPRPRGGRPERERPRAVAEKPARATPAHATPARARAPRDVVAHAEPSPAVEPASPAERGSPRENQSPADPPHAQPRAALAPDTAADVPPEPPVRTQARKPPPPRAAIADLPAALVVKKGEGLSPVAVAAHPSGSPVYVALASSCEVVAFDAAAGSVAARWPTPDRPSALAASPDGKHLYVTGASPAGSVHAIATSSGAVAWSVRVGHTPSALALSPDGATLYVCNRFDASVSIVDVARRAEIGLIPVAREPVAAALTPDGSKLFVANLVPATPANTSYVAAVVSAIDTATDAVTDVPLPNGATGVRGICASPDGRWIYATHVLARYQVPTTQVERGWMNTAALSIIDAAGLLTHASILLDDVDLGAANPWGVACTADGARLCVAHAGTHEVSVIDRAAMHAKLAKTTPVDGVADQLSFIVGLRRRVKLSGNGPRGIAVVGSRVFVAERFTDSIGTAGLDPAAGRAGTSIPLGRRTKMSVARRGRMLFNDATMCYQQWQSCASCHPGVRSDSLNWDLLNDGFGNPRNTKSLMLSHRTPPVMITGVRPKAETAVRAGMKFIQFMVRPEEDATALDVFLKSVRPVSSPHLVDGVLGESATRGAQVYKRAGCAACHRAPLYTDRSSHDVGTGLGSEEGRQFDTPTLKEIWRTAPYLLDGRAATMREVLTKYNREDRHGRTSSLSPAEIEDLVEYVLSL